MRAVLIASLLPLAFAREPHYMQRLKNECGVTFRGPFVDQRSITSLESAACVLGWHDRTILVNEGDVDGLRGVDDILLKKIQKSLACVAINSYVASSPSSWIGEAKKLWLLPRDDDKVRL
ncbi:hypothetical protein ETB97_005951 [Aspergillus alliaceus]|uniref:Uncharacterized protein n=1 Tax=Petromyces alliaceus TaxID=209559 RepID=A0A8H5ZVZ2_PETAA|nr:hypothetical protein ETB97_005951 [Aspergillus burnettii]